MLPPLTDIVTCMFYKPWTIYAPLWQTSWLTCSINRGQFLHWNCLNVSSIHCIDLNCSTSSMSLMWRSFTGSSPARPSEFVSVRRNNSCVAMETVWPGGSFLKYVGFAIRKRKRKKKRKNIIYLMRVHPWILVGFVLLNLQFSVYFQKMLLHILTFFLLKLK